MCNGSAAMDVNATYSRSRGGGEGVCWSKLGRIKGPKLSVDRWGTCLVFSTCQTQAHRADTWKHAEQASKVAAQSAAVAVEAFSFLPDLSGLPTQRKHCTT